MVRRPRMVASTRGEIIAGVALLIAVAGGIWREGIARGHDEQRITTLEQKLTTCERSTEFKFTRPAGVFDI